MIFQLIKTIWHILETLLIEAIIYIVAYSRKAILFILLIPAMLFTLLLRPKGRLVLETLMVLTLFLAGYGLIQHRINESERARALQESTTKQANIDWYKFHAQMLGNFAEADNYSEEDIYLSDVTLRQELGWPYLSKDHSVRFIKSLNH